MEVIKIRTNSSKKENFDVLLFEDKNDFCTEVDELKHNPDKAIDFSGESNQVKEQQGSLREGTSVTFFDETSRKHKEGVINSLKSTPYYEIEEDLTRFRFSVHKKYIKSTSPTQKTLAEIYIEKLAEYKYKHYDLGVVKGSTKTYETAVLSLDNLISKGSYVIFVRSLK